MIRKQMTTATTTLTVWTALTFLMLFIPTRERIRKVTRSGDRGSGGGGSTETILLAIAAIVVAGIVIAVIAARVNSEKGKVSGGDD